MLLQSIPDKIFRGGRKLEVDLNLSDSQLPT